MDGRSGWLPVPGCTDIEGRGQTVIYTNPAGATVPVLFRGRAWLE